MENAGESPPPIKPDSQDSQPDQSNLQEIRLNQEPRKEDIYSTSTIIEKLNEQIKRGNQPTVLVCDIDGTVYTKVKGPDGKYYKVGNNEETTKILQQHNIPLVLISGRPKWDEKGDEEMKRLGLPPADIVIAGAGTNVYVRQKDGSLKPDEEFAQLLGNQQISINAEEGTTITTNYDPSLILTALAPLQNQYPEILGLKIDDNDNTGFVTLTVENLSFEKLKELVRQIKRKISGVKISFSEDLEKIDQNNFSGWIQVIPVQGGKDRSLRFVAEKIANTINPNQENQLKPHLHVFGDAAIDIWMLAMGTSENMSYIAYQYVLSNSTPYTKKKLKKVMQALGKIPPDDPRSKFRRAHLSMVPKPGPDGIFKEITAITSNFK